MLPPHLQVVMQGSRTTHKMKICMHDEWAAFISDFSVSHSDISRNLVSHTMRWALHGRFIVLATVGSPNESELQFWDLDFNIEDASRRDTQQVWVYNTCSGSPMLIGTLAIVS